MCCVVRLLRVYSISNVRARLYKLHINNFIHTFKYDLERCLGWRECACVLCVMLVYMGVSVAGMVCNSTRKRGPIVNQSNQTGILHINYYNRRQGLLVENMLSSSSSSSALLYAPLTLRSVELIVDLCGYFICSCVVFYSTSISDVLSIVRVRLCLSVYARRLHAFQCDCSQNVWCM